MHFYTSVDLYYRSSTSSQENFEIMSVATIGMLVALQRYGSRPGAEVITSMNPLLNSNIEWHGKLDTETV